jgi:hypothetical protein
MSILNFLIRDSNIVITLLLLGFAMGRVGSAAVLRSRLWVQFLVLPEYPLYVNLFIMQKCSLLSALLPLFFALVYQT